MPFARAAVNCPNYRIKRKVNMIDDISTPGATQNFNRQMAAAQAGCQCQCNCYCTCKCWIWQDANSPLSQTGWSGSDNTLYNLAGYAG